MSALCKTPKAQRELAPGVRTLSLRARSLLLMAEGTPLAVLQAMYHGEGARLVAGLMAQGYLQPIADTLPAAPLPLDLGMAPDTVQGTAPAATSPDPIPAAPAPAENAPRPTPAGVSLAGARMHLFDLCERLFAHKHQDTALALRQRLREARDLSSMLEVRDLLLQAVAQLAGPERARSLGEQLAAMLPEHSLETGE